MQAIQSKVAGTQKLVRGSDPNQGRKLNVLAGITGVAANGKATAILPASRRFHCLIGKCTGVNYTGGVALPTVHTTGAGNDALTVTLALLAGSGTPGVVTVVAAGNGYNVGDRFKVTDATGLDGLFQVDTLTGGAGSGVATAHYVPLTATPGPIDPQLFFTKFDQRVNSVSMRNISLASYQRVLNVRGLLPALGEFKHLYTEDDRNFLGVNDSTAWDLHNGSKFELLFDIQPNIEKPGLVFEYEFDQISRITPGPQGARLFGGPVKYRETTINLNAGVNTFNDTTLVLGGEPILRMYLLGGTPGNITALEVNADGDQKLEGSVADLNNRYAALGFKFGAAEFVNSNYATSNAVKNAYNKPLYFDAAFIADIDRRPGAKLTYSKELKIKITSGIQQACTVVVETLPGGFR